jgi:simple sugar transport system permease protein
MNDSVLIQSTVVAITAGTPIVLAGTGEILTQRSGIMNLGVEGMMLIGAVTGFWATTATGSAWFGLAVAIVCGMAFALIHGALAIHLHANQIVSGIGLVILGTGLSQFIGEQGEPPVALRFFCSWACWACRRLHSAPAVTRSIRSSPEVLPTFRSSDPCCSRTT